MIKDLEMGRGMQISRAGHKGNLYRKERELSHTLKTRGKCDHEEEEMT